jgi:S1-C subfamily serine protease
LPGDLILSVDNEPEYNTREFLDHVAGQTPGASIAIGFQRRDVQNTANAVLAERPQPQD